MNIYYYAPSGAFIGDGIADHDPLIENSFLVPANATATQPPITGANQIAVFDTGLKTWSLQPDFRGQTFYEISTGNAVVITDIGEPPVGLAASQTTAQLLDTAQVTQTNLVIQSCQQAIVSGFQSAALGATHTYPSQPNDQTNLIGAVASGLATIDFWCADSNGTWAITPHTAVQIKQVLADGGVQRMSYSAKLDGLVKSIANATTPTEVQTFVW